MIRSFFLALLLVTTSLTAEVKAVIFDFGDVIIQKGDSSPFYNLLCDQLGINKDEAKALMKEYKADINAGVMPDHFWQNWAKKKDKILQPFWSERLEREVAKLMVATPGMPELVKEIRSQGYVTGLLSNVDRVHADFIRKTGLYNLFCPLLLSYELGVEKPDPHFYKILLAVLDLPPSDVIFIDDKEANVDAACKLGIDAIHFQSPDQLRAELTKRKVLKA